VYFEQIAKFTANSHHIQAQNIADDTVNRDTGCWIISAKMPVNEPRTGPKWLINWYNSTVYDLLIYKLYCIHL